MRPMKVPMWQATAPAAAAAALPAPAPAVPRSELQLVEARERLLNLVRMKNVIALGTDPRLSMMGEAVELPSPTQLACEGEVVPGTVSAAQPSDADAGNDSDSDCDDRVHMLAQLDPAAVRAYWLTAAMSLQPSASRTGTLGASGVQRRTAADRAAVQLREEEATAVGSQSVSHFARAVLEEARAAQAAYAHVMCSR